MGTGSYSGGYGEHDQGPSSNSSSSRGSSSSGGYSGKGGQDSPSEGGPGPGMGGGRSGSSGDGRSSGGGGRSSPEGGRGSMGGSGQSSSDSRDSLGFGRSDTPSSGRSSIGGNIGAGLTGGMTPSHRDSEIASMKALDHMRSLDQTSPTARDMQMASMRRASENQSMSTYNASRRTDLAQAARAAENQSMTDLARETALGKISAAEAGTTDPYNTISGGATADLANMTVRDAIAFSKTSWDGKIANVVGAYQFKDTTLASVAAKMGLMDAKMTPAVQDRLAQGLLQERANRATVNGAVDVDKFARELSKEWASLADVTGVSHYASNGIDTASVSYDDVHSMAKDLVSNGVVSPGKSLSNFSSTPTSAPTPTSRPDTRFSDIYMGKTGMLSDENANRAKSQEEEFFGETPTHGQTPEEQAQIASEWAAVQEQAANQPERAPPPNSRSKDAAAELYGATDQPGQFPERPRSGVETAAALGLDIGLGMLPGFGLVNGGLALTGNRTLGEHIVDSFVTGRGAGSGPEVDEDQLGGGRDRVAESKTTVPGDEGESFEERYLKYIDPTPRPKPAERWNYNDAGYVA